VRRADSRLGGDSAPAKLSDRPAGIPDFRHVANFPAGEFHHIDIIGVGGFAGRRAGTAFPAMGTGKHGIGEKDVEQALVRGRIELQNNVIDSFVLHEHSGDSHDQRAFRTHVSRRSR